MALIEIRSLTKLYRMGTSLVRALDGVDLDVARGEFVAITGPSGSGKSTLMHLLGCLDRPTSGRFVFDGQDVSDLSDRQLADIRNRQIGFVFQTFNLINRTSAVENVAVPLFYARRTNTRAPARKALEHVGLAERASHRSNELSGGERQRVAIARAIVNSPLLVLADEPTGNLDSHTGQQIMDLFRALNEQGVTVVVVTHEYDVAIQTRRMVQMRDGQIVSDRPTKEILKEDGRALHLQTRAGPALPDVRTPPSAPAAVTARAVGTPVEAERPPVLGPPRLVRGANAALFVGCLAILLMLAAFVVGRLVAPPPPADFRPGDPIPKELAEKALVLGLATLGALTGFVLGIVAVVAGWRARRRMFDELGSWRGGGRVWAAMVLGGLTVLAPLVSLGAAVLKGLLK